MTDPRRAWWTLEASDVLTELGSSRHGLDEDEAHRRLAVTGPNALEEAEGANPMALFLNQFKSPLIYILLVSAGLTTALREFTDTAIIAAVLVLNATIGFVQEYRAEQALRALRRLTVPRAAVLRAGRDREVDSREVVPGDIVLLESGSKVPADARLLQAAGLEVDESLLTGESTVIEKTAEPLDDPDLPVADRRNMVYMGSAVTRGRAHAVVTATGMATELGRIAGGIREAEEPVTPLQRRMNRFAGVLGTAIVAACAVAFPLGVAMGEPLTTMVRTVVALIVAAIPEGLPVVLTVTLAIGVNRMVRRGAIVRTLPAVETLGSCTVIGSDKTGTLTENRMTVQAVYTAGQLYSVSGTGYDLDGAFELHGQRVQVTADSPLHLTLLAGALNNEASLYRTDDRMDARGDPTEIALLVAATKAGIFKADVEEAFARISEIPFEPEHRFSASQHVHGELGFVLFVKGAPERVLAMCTQVAGPDEPASLDAANILSISERLGGQGLRVLAVAYKRARDQMRLDGEGPAGLTLLGLVGMMDPPRPEVPVAVAACQRAGIQVLMITGDHQATAAAVAGLVGIPAGEVIDGRQLERLTEEELTERTERVAVYARVAPEHKLRIVRALHKKEEIVAITGDGVNDAPALRAADIGVAMGQRGTDVAKEASDIVITDDNFATIVAAVEEGRVVFDNVRKVTFFLLSTGIAVVIATFVSILGGFPMPLLPAQIIWVNLVTNGVQDIALAFEPGEKDVLDRPPRPVDEGIMSRILWERTALVGIVIAAVTLTFFLTERYVADASLEHARTVALTTMVLFQAVHVGNARSEHLSAFAKSPFSNPFLFVGTIVALSIHASALYWGPSQALLQVEPLGLTDWLRLGAASASVVVVVELDKLIRRSGPGHVSRGKAGRASVS